MSRRLVAYVPLTPVDSATRVRVRGGELLVTDISGAAREAVVSGVAFLDGEWAEAIDYVAEAPLLVDGGVELREFVQRDG